MTSNDRINEKGQGLEAPASSYPIVFQNPPVIPSEEVFAHPKGRTSGGVWGSKHLLTRCLED